MARAAGRGSAVTAEGVVLRGPRGPVVQGVGLAARQGELVAMAGPHGSGRTSLLLALGGRLKVRGGSVRVGDLRLPGQESAVRQRVAVARALGAAEPDPYDTVAELLAGAGAYAGTGRITAGALHDALDAVGLAPADAPPQPAGPGSALPPHARYGDLHPLDRLLLAVALALPGNPSVVLVDEVGAGLDDHARQQAWRTLRRIADRGTTVVATCDSTAEAKRFAHRVIPLTHRTGPVATAPAPAPIAVDEGEQQ